MARLLMLSSIELIWRLALFGRAASGREEDMVDDMEGGSVR